MIKDDWVGVIVWEKNQFNVTLLLISAAKKAPAVSSNSSISVSRNLESHSTKPHLLYSLEISIFTNSLMIF
jgi:hypothetical protein